MFSIWEKWLDNFRLIVSNSCVAVRSLFKKAYKFQEKDSSIVEFYLVDAFEIYHFLPLYYYFEKNEIQALFVAEKPKRKKAWFNYDEAICILEKNGVRYKTKPNYDVDYVFTTQAESNIRNYKHKKIHMCYGVGLHKGSFSESFQSINGFDLKLVHGNISYDIVKKMGYLRYTDWGQKKYIYDISQKQDLISCKNKNNKPILLYFPTWDINSSICKYADAFSHLRDKFFIITKAHHCTFRLGSEEEHRRILNNISDIILEGNYSFEEAAKLSNFAICDAISGAATEVPYLNRDVKLILLKSPIEEKNHFKDFFDKYACCVSDSASLINAVDRLTRCDPYCETRRAILKELYAEDSNYGLEQIKEYINENCSKPKFSNKSRSVLLCKR